jgi:hypothetical protein
MEELRNHAQHRSLPTHGISFPMTPDESVAPVLMRFSVKPWVDVSELEDDPKFKKSVLADLQAVSDKNKHANLLPFIRAYAESIGKIHQCARELTVADVAKADDLIESYRTRYQDAFAHSLTGLAAIACDAQGLCTDHEYISDRPIKRRRALAEKNQHLDSLSRRYVSSGDTQ